MAQEQGQHRDDTLEDTGLFVNRFDDIEALNEFYAQHGWESDYRQLSPGTFDGYVSSRLIGSIGFAVEAMSRRVVTEARSPEMVFSAIMNFSDSEVRISGRRLDQGSVLVIPPETDMDVAFADDVTVLTVNLDEDTLGRYLGLVCGDDSLIETNDMTMLRARPRRVEMVHHMARRVLTESESWRPGNGFDSVAVRDMCSVLAPRESRKVIGDPYRRLEKQRIISRAKEYIREHLQDPIRVTDLCEYTGVSLSTLERMFRQEFDTTPNRYIRAARLHEVRREIRSKHSDHRAIADIALACGFTHMGRFSRQYQSHFGRLPSQERALVLDGA